MLERLVTLIIPASLLQRSDIGAAQRQLRLAIAIPLLAISGMLYSIPFFWMGLTGPALVSLVLGGGVLLGPWLLRWIGSVNVLAHILTATAFLHLTLVIGMTGGLHSVGVPWLVNAVLLALLLADRRAAVFWLGVALAEVGGLYVLERAGIRLPNYVPPPFDPFLEGIGAAGLVGVAFGLAYLFRRESDHSIRVLAEARREVRTVAHDGDESPTARIEALLALGRNALGVGNAHLVFVDRTRDHHEIVRADGSSMFERGETTPISESYCRHSLDGSTTFAFHDPEVTDLDDDVAHDRHGAGCYLSEPVYCNGDLYGTLCFADRTPREAFTEAEEQFAALLSTHVGRLLGQARRAGSSLRVE